jgi:hypothetical protein
MYSFMCYIYGKSRMENLWKEEVVIKFEGTSWIQGEWSKDNHDTFPPD